MHSKVWHFADGTNLLWWFQTNHLRKWINILTMMWPLKINGLLTKICHYIPKSFYWELYNMHSDLPTFKHFVRFLRIFFLNHAWRTHSSLMARVTHFWKNPYITCSNYDIVFSKPCHPCRLSSNNNRSKSTEETWTPNIRTHIFSNTLWQFMIKQTWMKQKKKSN